MVCNRNSEPIEFLRAQEVGGARSKELECPPMREHSAAEISLAEGDDLGSPLPSRPVLEREPTDLTREYLAAKQLGGLEHGIEVEERPLLAPLPLAFAVLHPPKADL